MTAQKNQEYEKWTEHSGESILVIINRNAPFFIMICNHSCICSSVKKRVQSWLGFELGNTTSLPVLWAPYGEIKTFVEGKLLLQHHKSTEHIFFLCPTVVRNKQHASLRHLILAEESKLVEECEGATEK